MPRRVFELLGPLLVLVSLWPFYKCIDFAAGQDYVAAVLAGAAGLGLLRAGVELARSAVAG